LQIKIISTYKFCNNNVHIVSKLTAELELATGIASCVKRWVLRWHLKVSEVREILH